MPFEQRSTERATPWGFPEGQTLLTCPAEDLLVYKAFAGRDRDWVDVDGILTRQGASLDFALVFAELEPLLALKEEPASLLRLRRMIERRGGKPGGV